MKKILLSAIVSAAVIATFNSQAWAMGHHHHHGSSTVSGASGTTTPNGTTTTTVSGATNNSLPAGGAAPVPEPLTLSLMGMGLSGMLLQRKLM